ncbi:MAG: DNA-deoxyinosine glycosylase [bacterium]|nr:DNA-deoxyinosine glycosylase [bacterium]
MHKAESFPPIATKISRVLILGSMPGIKSLAEQQYYAHPQNAFWKIMTALFDAPVETYPQRVALIKNNGLALWDVLKFCERHGSLDTRINDATIEVNDFAAFLKKYPNITHVFFNGAKSEQEFMKRVLPELPEKISARLELKRLPSTSPAHAGLKLADKLKAWKAVKG